VEEITYTVENLAPHVYYGIDFGYNDPTVVLTVGCKDQTVYIMDEIYITGATNNDLIHLMKQSIPRGALLVCDSSEPARITELSRSDWSAISAIKGKDSVMAGLDWLRTQQIVVSPRCTNTIKELGSYRYRQGKDGALLDEPLGFNDHCIDALRYSIESYRQASSATNITPDMIGRRRRYAE
jgi:phage terminase large subunit